MANKIDDQPPPPYYNPNESNPNTSNIESYQYPWQPMGHPTGIIQTIIVPTGTPICPNCQVRKVM